VDTKSAGIPVGVLVNIGPIHAVAMSRRTWLTATNFPLYWNTITWSFASPPTSGSFQSSIATSVALELSSRGTWNTRHPATYFSPHGRCSPTRAESSRSGYDVTAPAQNHALPAWDDRENGLTKNDILSGDNADVGDALIARDDVRWWASRCQVFTSTTLAAAESG